MIAYLLLSASENAGIYTPMVNIFMKQKVYGNGNDFGQRDRASNFGDEE
jgi:hypothetical protein